MKRTAALKAPNQLVIPEQLPFLESICWQTRNVYRFTPQEMLNRYERGWSYRDLFNNLTEEERDFIKEIARRYKSWLQLEGRVRFRSRLLPLP